MQRKINYSGLAMIGLAYFALIGVAIVGRVEPLQRAIFG